MNIQDLVGFTLDSCRFSKSSYTFEFSGRVNGEFRTFLVSTSYNFSLPGEKFSDACEKFSLDVWVFLEKKVTSIYVVDNERLSKVVFNFEGSAQFIIWSEAPLIDNLLIITNQETGDWFPVS